MSNFANFNLVCPHCYAQNGHTVDLDLSLIDLICPKCRLSFSTRIVKARSRNSRQVKISKGRDPVKLEERHFSIRVRDFRGGEDLIEFANNGRRNFEFRSGDTVAFTYRQPQILGSLRGNKLAVVQNFTIDQWMKIAPAPKWLPFVSSLILVLLILFLCRGCAGI
jgi:hypothetical protein